MLQTAKIKERFDSLGVTYSGTTQTGGLTSSHPDPVTSAYFYHSDHLGSSSLITDVSGNLVQHLEYVPYGEVFIDEKNSTWSTPYKFNAKELDEETGLYYYGARYYDPRTSVWISSDPLREMYPNVSSYNYCLGNPVIYIDPDGRGVSSPETRTALFFLRHPGIASAIGDVVHGSTNISTNSARFALNTGLREISFGSDNIDNMGSEINAFRHVLWQSTITAKYGENIAKQVGSVHEINPDAIKNGITMSFKGADAMIKADETIDLLNNIIGRSIGVANPNADMKTLAIKTLDYFYENGLYVAGSYSVQFSKGKLIVNSVSISLEKLSDEAYQNALKTLSSTDTNGYTPQQWIDRLTEIAKQNQMAADANKKVANMPALNNRTQ